MVTTGCWSHVVAPDFNTRGSRTREWRRHMAGTGAFSWGVVLVEADLKRSLDLTLLTQTGPELFPKDCSDLHPET
jgi:hypothetical protein